MKSALRRYRSLMRLAQDQAGKPEGETAAAVAAAIAKRDPSVLHGIDVEVDPETREIRYKSEADRDALIWCFNYIGVKPLTYVKSRKKVVIGEDIPSLLDAVETAFASVRHKHEEILRYASAGFLMGCMPRKIERDSDDEDDSEPPDPAVLEAARAARAAGRGTAIRKQIESKT